MLSPNGWMNETLTAEWIKQIWGPRQTNKRMLVINTTFLHACMKKAVQNTNTIMDVVPGGSAKLIQPANVSRNAPLQGCISQIIYDTWLTSGTMERTRVAWQLTVHLQKHLGFNGFWKPGLNQARNNHSSHLRHVVSQ